MTLRKLIKILGPGLLYAGAAVGVSHLVQSTRAGADYGYQLLLVLILANLIKYPFFEFGPRYVAATGNHLIDAYHKIGKWAVITFGLLTVSTMFAVQAAVTIVTAGLFGTVFNIELDSFKLSLIILAITSATLIIGRYKILDKLIKIVIVLLAISTLVAVIVAFQSGNTADGNRIFSVVNEFDLLFLIAFIGWMPAPIDVSVWQSLWGVAKAKSLGYRPSLRESRLDFNIGYFGTMFLAIGFLILGALIMYGSSEGFSDSSVGFAGQLINLYTESIGQWAWPLIAFAALATMFSTTLTVMDAYPRIMTPVTESFVKKSTTTKSRRISLIWYLILISGAILLLLNGGSMKTMVDLATTLSFVTAPILAILNFKAVTHKHMPEEAKPGKLLRIYAIIGIIVLSVFTLYYLFWRFII